MIICPLFLVLGFLFFGAALLNFKPAIPKNKGVIAGFFFFYLLICIFFYQSGNNWPILIFLYVIVIKIFSDYNKQIIESGRKSHILYMLHRRDKAYNLRFEKTLFFVGLYEKYKVAQLVFALIIFITGYYTGSYFSLVILFLPGFLLLHVIKMVTTIYGNFPIGNWKILLWDACKFCGVAGGSVGVGIAEGEKYYSDVNTSDGAGKRFYTKTFQGTPNTHSGDVFGKNVGQALKNTYGFNNWENECIVGTDNYMDTEKPIVTGTAP
jgi:hypothetical protein